MVVEGYVQTATLCSTNLLTVNKFVLFTNAFNFFSEAASLKPLVVSDHNCSLSSLHANPALQRAAGSYHHNLRQHRTATCHGNTLTSVVFVGIKTFQISA
jgi:hypothetical protein